MLYRYLCCDCDQEYHIEFEKDEEPWNTPCPQCGKDMCRLHSYRRENKQPPIVIGQGKLESGKDLPIININSTTASGARWRGCSAPKTRHYKWDNIGGKAGDWD